MTSRSWPLKQPPLLLRSQPLAANRLFQVPVSIASETVISLLRRFMWFLADGAAKSLERLAWVVALPTPLDSWSRQGSWSRHARGGWGSCPQMPVFTQGGLRDLDAEPGSQEFGQLSLDDHQASAFQTETEHRACGGCAMLQVSNSAPRRVLPNWHLSPCIIVFFHLGPCLAVLF